MKTKTHVPTEIEPRLTRGAELRWSLEERRRELVASLHERMRVVICGVPQRRSGSVLS
jgi:hypothetical protein